MPDEWQSHVPFGDEGESPTAEQAAFLRDTTSRFKMLVGGVGSGKSRGTSGDTVLKAVALNPGVDGGVVGLTFPQMERTIIPEIVRGLERCYFTTPDGSRRPFRRGVPGKEARSDFTYIPSKRIIHVNPRGMFKRPSLIQFESADVERLYAYSWGWANLDELGSWSREEWFAAQGRVFRVRCPVMQVGASTTPEGLNWFSDVVEENADNPLWNVIIADTRDAHFQTDEYISNLIAQYPSDLLAERLAGQFLAVGVGVAFPHWNARAVADREAAICNVSADPIVATIDWGGSNFALVVGQSRVAAGGRRMAVALQDYKLTTSSISNYAHAFLADWHHHLMRDGVQIRRLELDGDPQGHANYGLGQTQFDAFANVLREAGIEFEYRFRTRKGKPAAPDPRHRIATGDSMMERDLVVISRNAPNLLRDIQSARYSQDGRRLDKGDGSASHYADAFLYWLYRVAGERAVGVEPPPIMPRPGYAAAWDGKQNAREVDEDSRAATMRRDRPSSFA